MKSFDVSSFTLCTFSWSPFLVLTKLPWLILPFPNFLQSLHLPIRGHFFPIFLLLNLTPYLYLFFLQEYNEFISSCLWFFPQYLTSLVTFLSPHSLHGNCLSFYSSEHFFLIFFFVHLLLLALSVILKNIRIAVLDDDKDPLTLVLNRGQFKYTVLVPMILSQIQ